jgi:DNA recombination protein RmuC
MPIVTLVLLVVVLALLIVLLMKTPKVGSATINARLDAFEKAQERTERAVREEIAKSREELGKAAKEQRQELTEAFKAFDDSSAKRTMEAAGAQRAQLDAFSGQLTSFTKVSGERLDGVRSESADSAKQLREEVVKTFNSISDSMANRMRDLAADEKLQFEAFSGQIASLTKTSGEKLDGIKTESATGGKQLREEVEKKLEAIRGTVEGELRRMQDDNAKQLEQMRQTVDEKLQGTLEKRLGESFKQVSERLEQVHAGLGEMQTLATGVGDLKKALTNVKTRGGWAEKQLGELLEEVLSPEQFETNVSTKNASERVEFAVKLPGQGANKDETVWLPIDAKFPIEDYHRLTEAQERADLEAIESAGKQLENRVKACAREISEKYLNPPATTDFGILFLPREGLFAEVLRRTGLAEVIQREYRVVIAGPTTLWAFLNSLQMGFRTLLIQKRSSEVWNTLAAVKNEWSKYGSVLEAVQKKLHQASETIEKAQVRSRAIGRQLRDVQELPPGSVAALLPASPIDDELESSEGEVVEDAQTTLDPISLEK